MIADLKPYPVMRNSGVPWLGAVPTHWRTHPVRRYCRVFAGATPSRSVAHYWENGSIPWLSSGDVNLRRIRTARQFITDAGLKNSSANWIRPGSLVVALAGQGKTKGMVATVEVSTTCNQSLAVIEPADSESRYEYLAYYLESRYQDIRALVGDGLRDGLNLEHVRSIPTPLPPLAEQAAIVRFLDHADRRIRRYIRAQQQLVMLLEEQKQAIIHQAITGQIDVRTGQPYPAYKPSGVEWLGDVPAHWERARLKAFLLRPMRNGLFKKKDAFGSGVPLVNVADIYHNSFQIDPASLDRVQTTPDEMSTYQVRTGDLLFVRSSLKLEGTGRSAVAIDCAADSVFECHLVQGRPDPRRAVARFLAFQLNSFSLRHYLISRANVVTMATVSQGVLASCPVFLPSISEQEGLLKQIDGECVRVSATHDRARLEIDLLREYRTRLIADVVTGKFDVREAAARLPDEVEELEPLDEADALIDGEDEPTDALATAP